MERYFIAGGAGFIGSHLARRLLADEPDCTVTIFDNFSSGQRWHLAECLEDRRLTIVTGDLKDLPALVQAIAGHSRVFHFASNPDIAKAMTQPDVDFWEGTYLTQNLLEAMRQTSVPRITYASGSGVYGETGTTAVDENYSPLQPISTYGASKLAGEAMLSAYAHMFGISASAFRFANVVGPRQTHGVTFDFVRRLLQEPGELRILGDGSQSKSYIDVDDVVNALLLIDRQRPSGFDCYNVATEDYVTVTEIAHLVVSRLGLTNVRFRYTGGDRGWKGDVPVVRFCTDKLRAQGWRNRHSSLGALTRAIDSCIEETRRRPPL